MLGWSNDGTRLIFEADPVGTDLVPSGHLLVDPRTRDLSGSPGRPRATLPGTVTVTR